MEIFISWSGARSREVGEALKKLIESCLSPTDVWISSIDMDTGARWYEEIVGHLADSQAGIVCLTKENVNSPWVLFESGALLKTGALIPFLVDVPPKDIPPPMQAHQACRPTPADTLKMLQILNAGSRIPFRINDTILQARFEAFWPFFESVIAGTRPRNPGLQNWLGVEGIYRNRHDCFEHFVPYLNAELADHPQRIWIIGSSLQGFDIVVGTQYTIWDAIDAAVGSKCLRIILTAPEISHLRDGPEGRIPGQIKQEIGTALTKLLTNHAVPESYIRLYPGSPTVTAIATSNHMLINPFPYCRSSYHCFCLIACRTGDSDDIYGQYISDHFERGWDFARPL